MKRMIDNKDYEELKNNVSDIKSHYVKSVVEYEDESNNKYSTQFYRKDTYLNMYVSKNNETRYIIQAHGDDGIELTYQQKTGVTWQDNPITKKLTLDSNGAKIDGKSISTERLFKTKTDATEEGGVYTKNITFLEGIQVNDYLLYVNSGVATTLYQVASISGSEATLNVIASFGGGGSQNVLLKVGNFVSGTSNWVSLISIPSGKLSAYTPQALYDYLVDKDYSLQGNGMYYVINGDNNGRICRGLFIDPNYTNQIGFYLMADNATIGTLEFAPINAMTVTLIEAL